MNNLVSVSKSTKVNLVTWQESFSCWLIQEGRANRTVKAYLQDLEQFATWFEERNGEPFQPALINMTDLRSYRSFCVDVIRQAPATWNRRRMALRVFCAWAASLFGNVPVNWKAIRPAESTERAPRWLTNAERSRLIRQSEIEINAATTELRRWRSIRDQAVLSLMLYGGLRIGEVLSLRLADVELSERKGMVTFYGKGSKRRTVPLSASARAALQMWLDVRGEWVDPWLFVTDDGRSLSTRAFEKRLAELGRLARIDGLTPHALRHTCAKTILDAEHPLSEVMVLLGHARLQTTLRYVQPGREDLERAVEAGDIAITERRLDAARRK